MIADNYLRNMLKVDTTKENFVQEFLTRSGRFAHIMAHIFPFKLGSAGITEWLIRAAAHSKGINLGEFNLSEGLSWDFKVLVTANRDTYANWFAEHAFIKPELSDPSKDFSFNRADVYAEELKSYALGLFA